MSVTITVIGGGSSMFAPGLIRQLIEIDCYAGDSGAARSMLARGAASYLERVMRDGIVVAVGLSRTIAEMPSWLSNARPAKASFVSLAGALRVGGEGSGNSYQATDALARAFGGRFFDRNGLQIRHEVNGRVIALDLDEFVKLPVRVLAAAGPSKVEAIAAALRGGLATVLVTDVDTAHALIRDVQ